jgi:hypothetical protein
MRIVKPHGKSQTELHEGRHLRRIAPYRDLTAPTSVELFVLQEPKLVIAQWTSILDRVANKPYDGSPPTSEQRAFREVLGTALFKRLTEHGLLPDPFGRQKRLERQWHQRVHPYGSDIDDTKKRNAKGSWYWRFADAANVLDNDPAELARRLHEHLYHQERRLHNEAPNKARGLIEGRARSIANNVLRPLHLSDIATYPWASDDVIRFISVDVAGVVHRYVSARHAEGKWPTKSTVMSQLADHWRRFAVAQRASDNGAVERSQVSSGLLALHRETQKFYSQLLERRGRLHPAQTPETALALIERLCERVRNRQINGLIRLGRVIHHECSPIDALDSPRAVLVGWPTNIEHSRYWRSAGQTHVKRQEAFVRVWRGVISDAARTVHGWADPSRKIEGDILGAQQTRYALASLDHDWAAQHATLLFGRHARALSSNTVGALVEAALLGVRSLRNASFHYKGRQGFVGALEALPISRDVEHFIAGLWTADLSRRVDRFLDTVRTVKLDRLLTVVELNAVALACAVSPHAVPVPRLKRVLARAQNAWSRPDFRLNLPPVRNQAGLSSDVALAQYVTLKLIYERGFGAWLAQRPAPELMSWVERAIARTTNDARRINHDDKASARASGLIRLQDGETIHDLFDKLAVLVATENRVQQGYRDDQIRARQNSKYLEDLRCDVIAQSLQSYLESQELAFILTLSRRSLAIEGLPVHAWAQPSAADENPERWEQALYFLVHLMPVDAVARLRHQMVRWDPSAQDALRARIDRVLTLYLDMHDAVFDGAESVDVERLQSLVGAYENKETFTRVVSMSPAEELVQAQRSLRESLRFALEPVLAAYGRHRPVTSTEVEAWIQGATDVVRAHERRVELHGQWVQRRLLDESGLLQYQQALQTVVEHRFLASRVLGKDLTRLHRLLLSVLARLVDFSGLWERDLYFVTLALLYVHGRSPSNVFEGDGRSLLGNGQIVAALRLLSRDAQCDRIRSALIHYYGADLTQRRAPTVVKHRNHLAHFNMLQPGQEIDLTDAVNRTRSLMSYDRKKRNGVSNAVRDLLDEFGLAVQWSLRDGHLVDPGVRARVVTHLDEKRLREPLCGPAFVELAARLFQGHVVAESGVG